MKCPRDGQALAGYTYKKVPLDCCPYCNGAWLDKSELAQITQKSKDIFTDLDSMESLPRSRLKCPKCGVDLAVTYYTKKKDVEVDLCPQCGGIWLDTDELKDILKIASSENLE